MFKKVAKSQKNQKNNTKSPLCHPSTWLICALTLALLVVCGITAYGFKKLESKTQLESAKLEIFDHLVESYIRDMEFIVDYDQSAITQATGYGVSDEDGVFYITFDFAKYPTEDTTTSSFEELNPRHGIVYFQWDAEHNAYGHAFSYHDDSYRPGGIYVKL